jgi:hypothetical protein
LLIPGTVVGGPRSAKAEPAGVRAKAAIRSRLTMRDEWVWDWGFMARFISFF